jgi:hypothetical protein
VTLDQKTALDRDLVNRVEIATYFAIISDQVMSYYRYFRVLAGTNKLLQWHQVARGHVVGDTCCTALLLPLSSFVLFSTVSIPRIRLLRCQLRVVGYGIWRVDAH